MKKLDQSVFDGLPPEYEWAAVDSDLNEGAVFAYACKPVLGCHGRGYWLKGNDDHVDAKQLYLGGDTTDWKNSLIRRDRCNDCPNKTDGVCCGQAV